jgi:hypothetical protein
MGRIIQILTLLLAPLAAGCGGLKSPDDPTALPVRYHDAQYDLTFFLPADWRGYSVRTEQWEVSAAPLTNAVTPAHGPKIILRHPQWRAGDPYQDIPIDIFTRAQWGQAWQTGNFPTGAGGVEFEIAHNGKYVFGIHSRFAADDSVKGCEEASRAADWNITAGRPHLHPM